MSLVQNRLCSNGCGTEMKIWDLIQISNPEGTRLMLVCEECLMEDDTLADWEVDFIKDPR